MPVVRVFVVVVMSALLASSSAGAARERTIADLTNFSLSPELSQWLVGPVSKIASNEEIEDYLALRDDAGAREFIEEFWRRRHSEQVAWPDRQARALFERRVEEADRLFTEGVNLGRRTARGEIHVLYGPPAEKRYDSDPDTVLGPIELWEYDKKAEKGLDGRRPKRVYRFVEREGVTVLLGSADKSGRILDREIQD